jgi:hypothetical protein
MLRRITRTRPHRDDARPARSRKARPILEGMEDRLLLASTLGAKFTYNRITYSFMPDGTSIGGVPSNLFQTLNAVTTTANWQLQFEKAAAVWQQVANVNLVLVPDDGAPLGSGSYQQGDPGMGDIRIGAMAQSSGVLAYTLLPPPYSGGSAAGDIVFNSSQPWHVGLNYDIETVAIHEIGHALGMGHSQLTAAEMYAYYQGVKQTLDPDDIAGVQSIWGAAPSPASGVDGSLATAFNTWPWYAYQSNLQTALSGLSIVNSTDNQYFYVFVPWNTSGQMTVTMQSASASALTPQVALLDASGNVLSQVSATSNGTTASITYNVSPGQAYYVRTSAAAGGAGSSGSYGLSINLGSSSQSLIPNSMATAIDTWNSYANQGNLQGVIPNLLIANSTDYQYFRVFVPWNTSGQMTVTMQSSGLSSLSPRVMLLDANGRALVQSSAPNVYGATVSVTYNVSPGQVYYVRTSAANSGPGSNGAYGLEINLGSAPVTPIPPPNTAVAAQPDQGGGNINEAAGVVASGPHGRALGPRGRPGRDRSDSDTIVLGNQVVAGESLTAVPALRARQAGLNPLHLRSGVRRVPQGPIAAMHSDGGAAAAHHRAALGPAGRRNFGRVAGPGRSS